jgi:hypothetical protein
MSSIFSAFGVLLGAAIILVIVGEIVFTRWQAYVCTPADRITEEVERLLAEHGEGAWEIARMNAHNAWYADNELDRLYWRRVQRRFEKGSF